MTRRRAKKPASPQTGTAPQKVRLGSQRVSLDDKNLLGVGGEARVYALPQSDLALKIFHPISTGLPTAERRAAERQRALRWSKLAVFPKQLSSSVIGPRELVYDAKSGDPVGYAMARVDGAHELHRLAQRRWREGVVSNQQVTALFRALYLTVSKLHDASVVIGDFNDGNALFSAPASSTSLAPTPSKGGGGPLWLIDADSMQFGGFPCVVGHERFLDPRLYGKNLTATPSFDAGTDWYAFSVLLFGSLLYVHPYGGVCSGYPTLLRRAEARISVLSQQVKRPKAAIDPRVLGDALYDHFEQVFDHDRRTTFPATLLETTWRLCGSCGVEHAHPRCPLCHTAVAVHGTLPFDAPVVGVPVVGVPFVQRVVDHGGCRVTSIFETRGRILAAAVQGKLRWVVQEGEIVRREDGQRVLEQSLRPGMRFAPSGTSTWIGLGNKLVRVEGETPREHAHTALGPGGESAFDANGAGCYRLADGWLLDHGPATRIGPVLCGQTWLRVGEHHGFGFYRAGLLTVFFVFDSSRPGLLPVSLPAIEGHLVDATCAFDDGHVLFGLATESGGRRQHALYLLDKRGNLCGQRVGAPDETPFLASVRGKALLGGRVLSASEQGLLSLAVDGGQLVVSREFPDTRPFLGDETELLPGPAGSVYAVTTKEINQLTLTAPAPQPSRGGIVGSQPTQR